MGRGIVLLGCILAFVFSPLSSVAASKAHKGKTVSSKAHTIAAKKRVSSRKIINTLRASRQYRMQPVNYNRNGNILKTHNNSRAVAHGNTMGYNGDEGIFQNESGGQLRLQSSKALIINQNTGEVLYAKSTDIPTPIASVTKLMTAMVLLDQHVSMDELISVGDGDVDTLKGTTSRLRVGTTLSRREMLQLALMSSENRAASALARTSPLGLTDFIVMMNNKAVELGMTHTRFADPTGLNSANVSTAEDLAKMVKAAYQYPEIRLATTTVEQEVSVTGYRRPLEFRNTNVLVRNGSWDIGLSKTGYINEAGRCLVMQAQIADQPLIIVLLDSWGKFSRIGDAQRIRKWIESSVGPRKLG